MQIGIDFNLYKNIFHAQWVKSTSGSSLKFKGTRYRAAYGDSTGFMNLHKQRDSNVLVVMHTNHPDSITVFSEHGIPLCVLYQEDHRAAKEKA